MQSFKIGDKVTRAGYPGTVVFVHKGRDPRSGMIDVRLPGGVVTVSICEVKPA